MTTALDLALSVSLASYAKDHSVQAVVTISNQKLVKVERPKAVKRAAAPKAAPQVDKPTAPSPNAAMATSKLPPAGTLGAKGFIMMMNRAKSRDEKIVAIASYIGYDVGGDFATQEMAAQVKEIRVNNNYWHRSILQNSTIERLEKSRCKVKGLRVDRIGALMRHHRIQLLL
jgi:hypothetical protein